MSFKHKVLKILSGQHTDREEQINLTIKAGIPEIDGDNIIYTINYQGLAPVNNIKNVKEFWKYNVSLSKSVLNQRIYKCFLMCLWNNRPCVNANKSLKVGLYHKLHTSDNNGNWSGVRQPIGVSCR